MSEPLSTLTVTEFLDRLASRAPTPGGGSASALAGATAASLVAMVLELSAGRTDAVDASTIGEQLDTANRLRAELAELVELDAAAYDGVVAARRLPRDTADQVATRRARIADATREATQVPTRIAARAADVLGLAEQVAAYGARSAISDVGVAGELAAAAVRGAVLNVRINLPFLAEGDPVALEATAEIDRVLAESAGREAALRAAMEAV